MKRWADGNILTRIFISRNYLPGVHKKQINYLILIGFEMAHPYDIHEHVCELHSCKQSQLKRLF